MEISRTSIRKGGSPVYSQYSSGRGEWRQWGTTVGYGPMGYQVRLKPNYGERHKRDERKVPGALLRSKR